jgi:hypothetical protein
MPDPNPIATPVALPNYSGGQGIPTYPSPYGATQGGGTAGLVDKNKIINDSVQNAINQTQQLQKMQRDTQAYKEQQARNKGVADASNPPGASPSMDHSGFMDNVLHGLSSLGTGIKSIFGGGSTPAGIPAGPSTNAPAPQMEGPPTPQMPPPDAATAGPPTPAPPTAVPVQSQEDGGPVEPTITKSTTGDLLAQAVKEAGRAIFGTGAAARAGDKLADRDSQIQKTVVQSQMRGGVVRAEGTTPQFMKPQPTVLAFQSGGAIPAGPQSGFGVRDGGSPGIRGFEAGGAIPADANAPAAQEGPPSPTAAMDPATAQAHMSDIIDKLHGDMHAHALGDDDQSNHSRAIPIETISPAEAKQRQDSGGYLANGHPAPPVAMVDTGASDSAPPPAAPQGNAPTPAPQGAAPTSPGAPGSAPSQPPSPAIAASAASVQAVQNAPADDPAKTGVQTTSPSAEGKPHSITPDTWNKWDDSIDHAVYLSALAGHDPGQVRQALEANRNAYIQGHVLRYLASANVALQNGDQKGVEAAMRNAYYYMPDGQDLTVQKGPGGQLMYQDPVNPTKLDGNNVSRPNMIPVDAAHLQLLGQAMLNPMQVNQTIMEIRSSQAVAGLKQAQAAAAGETGRGNLLKGEGYLLRGQSEVSRDNAQNYKDLSAGDMDRARATWLQNHINNTVRQNKIDPQLVKGANDAGQMFEDAAQGQKTTVQGDPMTNPNVGKTTRDPTKSSIPGATPADIVSGKALASDIFMGGGGTVTAARAAQLATLAYTAKRSSHAGPNGKSVADFQTDPRTGDTHVWNKATKSWEAFKLPLTSANDAASGKMGPSSGDLDDVTRTMLAGNSSGQGGIPSGQDMPDEPDMKDQDMVDDDQKTS